MPIPRRFIAFLLSSFCAVATFAQTAPAEVTDTGKLTLSDAIQRALAKNFAIKVEGFDAQIASARVTESLGKFDPVLSGTYTYSESNNPSLLDATTGLRPPAGFTQTNDYDVNVGGLLPWGLTYQLGATTTNTRGTFNSYTDNYLTFAGVSGRQPLLRNFGFGPTLASIRVAQVNRNISEWQFRQTLIDTVTQVIFAYHNLNFAYANYRSAVRSRDGAAQLLAENEKRFKTGSHLCPLPHREPRGKHSLRRAIGPRIREYPQAADHRHTQPGSARRKNRHRGTVTCTHRYGRRRC